MITRNTDTDDDGTGTTGTIHNNAWLQSAYDTLDARWSVVTITSTGTQNNLDITQADFVIFNNGSDLTVTGILAPSSPSKPGKPVRYVCTGAGNVFFKHQNTGSTAANRFINIATSGDTPHAGASGCGLLSYDSANSRWRLLAHEQGAALTPTYASGDYTASAGTWTVESGDVTACTYHLRGRLLTVNLELGTTSVSTTPASLKRAIPGGFTAAARSSQNDASNDNAGGYVLGLMQVLSTGTTMGFSKLSGNWSASTNNTTVYGCFIIEVT